MTTSNDDILALTNSAVGLVDRIEGELGRLNGSEFDPDLVDLRIRYLQLELETLRFLLDLHLTSGSPGTEFRAVVM